jgi:hypothetical protein
VVSPGSPGWWRAGPTHRDRHLQQLCAALERDLALLDRLPQALAHRRRSGQHQDLFSAHPHHMVAGSHHRGQGLAHGHQHLIARGMAPGVVEAFEVVNVDHEQVQTLVVLGLGRQQGRQMLAQPGAVLETGELVEERFAAKLP